MVYINIIKAQCHSYQDYAQTSVCMFTSAMETPINKVKMPFFIITFFAASKASKVKKKSCVCCNPTDPL